MRPAAFITPLERELIPKLFERVKNELVFGEPTKTKEDQDLYLVRWLRARDHNLEKATEMLLNSLKWRRENDVNNIFSKPVDPVLKRQFQFSFPGVDKFGHPVILMPLETFDFRLVVETKKYAEFDIFVINFFESILREIRKADANRLPGQPRITQCTFIINTKGYAYSQILNMKALKKFLSLGSVYEAHYPEVLFTSGLVNFPSYMNIVISAARAILAKKTMDKIKPYSSMADWKKALEDIADPAIIPVAYGGCRE